MIDIQTPYAANLLVTTDDHTDQDTRLSLNQEMWIAEHGSHEEQVALACTASSYGARMYLAKHGSFDCKYHLAHRERDQDILLQLMEYTSDMHPKEAESITGQILCHSESVVLLAAMRGSFSAKKVLAERSTNISTLEFLVQDDDLKILERLLKRELSFDLLYRMCRSRHQMVVWSALDHLAVNHQAITSVFHDEFLLSNPHVIAFQKKYERRL